MAQEVRPWRFTFVSSFVGCKVSPPREAQIRHAELELHFLVMGPFFWGRKKIPARPEGSGHGTRFRR